MPSAGGGAASTAIAYTALDAYGTGTAYSLTATPAAVVFGTTSPTLTIATAGTYRIRGVINMKYNAATMIAGRTITAKLRRTNNTAADLTSGVNIAVTAVTSTLTQTWMQLNVAEVSYVASAGDVVTLFGSMDVIPSAGSLDVVEAEIHAVRYA